MGKLRVLTAAEEIFRQNQAQNQLDNEALYFLDNGCLYKGGSLISPLLINANGDLFNGTLNINLDEEDISVSYYDNEGNRSTETISSYWLKSTGDTISSDYIITSSAAFLNESYQNILSVSADKTLNIGADPFSTVIKSPLTCELATTLKSTLNVTGSSTFTGLITASGGLTVNSSGNLTVNHQGGVLYGPEEVSLVNYKIPTTSGYTYGQIDDTIFGAATTNCVLRSSSKSNLLHASADGRFTVYTSGNCDYSTIGAAPESHTHKDSDITLTGSAKGTVTALDAMSSLFDANRLAFAHVNGMTVQYSNDSGTTWKDYSASNVVKTEVLSNIMGNRLYLGKKTSGSSTSSDKLRIILDAYNLGVYTSPTKLFINWSTASAPGSSVLVESCDFGGSYTTIGTFALSGDTGWNSIPLNIKMFGSYNTNSDSVRVRYLRLTFSTTGNSRSGLAAFVCNLAMLGITSWTTPSNLAATNHLYSYDSEENMILPNSIWSETGELGQVDHPWTHLYMTGSIIGSDPDNTFQWTAVQFGGFDQLFYDSSSGYTIYGSADLGQLTHHWGQDFEFELPVIFDQGYSESSDIRKKDIKEELDLKSCYELLDKCSEVIYTLKDDTKEQIGMIAQEVEEVFPELVAEDTKGYKSLQYSRLSVVCLKILKDISDRLEKIENKLNL